MATLTKKQNAYIQDDTIDVPRYDPSEAELMHIGHIYQRMSDMKSFVEGLGLYEEWSDAEKYFVNDQMPKKTTELPKINLGTEVEIVETKSSEETKVLPEVVLKPVYEEDTEKVEALQKVLEYVKEKNNDDLLKSKMLKFKNIYGVSFQKVYWKEVWRDVKIVTGEEKKGKNIGDLKWTKQKVLKYRDICIENIEPYHLLFSEEARTIDEANEAIQIFYYKDLNKAREDFGEFENFKYVQKGQYQEEVLELLQTRNIDFNDEEIDIFGLYYWNVAKDEYSIIINGVLMTQYGVNGGNPIPCLYWKELPFVRAACRVMPGGRQFYPKGDVTLIKRIKESKNIIINAIMRATQTNSKSVLITSKELAGYLQKLGFSWEDANILPVNTKDEASIVRPVTIQTDIQGAMQLLQKLDEYQTIITGIDTHSLLASVQETATKTAVRAETSIKRIADGLKLIEYETLIRKTKILLALLRQYYKEEQDYLNIDNIKNGKFSKVTVKNTIPVDDVKYSWSEAYKAVTLEELQKVEGITPEFVTKVFYSNDGETFEFLVKDDDEMKRMKAFMLLPEETQKGVLKLMEAKKFNKLNKEDAVGETTQLEIRKELFETEHEVKIQPRGTLSYSELYEREKSDAMLERFLGNPLVNQSELIKQNFEANGINSDNYIRDEDEVKAEQEELAMQEQQASQQGKQQGQGNLNEVIKQVSNGQGTEQNASGGRG